jgi:hypothetical protein
MQSPRALDPSGPANEQGTKHAGVRLRCGLGSFQIPQCPPRPTNQSFGWSWPNFYHLKLDGFYLLHIWAESRCMSGAMGVP